MEKEEVTPFERDVLRNSKTSILRVVRFPEVRELFREFYKNQCQVVITGYDPNQRAIVIVTGPAYDHHEQVREICRQKEIKYVYEEAVSQGMLQTLHEFFISELEAEETCEFLLDQKLDWASEAPPKVKTTEKSTYILLDSSDETKLCEKVANALDERGLDPAKCQIVQYSVPQSINGAEQKVYARFHAVIYYRP
jgi:hypothetical protein